MKVEQLTLFDMPAESKPKSVCLSIGDFAKVLSSKGFDIGQIRLFQALRKWRMLNKENVPFQYYIDKGYFKTIQQRFKKGNNTFDSVYLKVLVTPSGQKRIEEMLADERNGNWS